MIESAAPPPPPPTAGTSSRATTSLVLGILGFLCCQLCAPFAWYLGSQELRAIRAGLAPAGGEGVARAGWILGIIGSLLLVFVLFWIALGGFAMIMSAVQEMGKGG